mmetsp:Transcript_113787/g.354429  ORF Transcript_113787/g.354429 Transcript_113787/m.354429 type:complete len:216 (-) Transcript_113787:177-824(-)
MTPADAVATCLAPLRPVGEAAIQWLTVAGTYGRVCTSHVVSLRAGARRPLTRDVPDGVCHVLRNSLRLEELAGALQKAVAARHRACASIPLRPDAPERLDGGALVALSDLLGSPELARLPYGVAPVGNGPVARPLAVALGTGAPSAPLAPLAVLGGLQRTVLQTPICPRAPPQGRPPFRGCCATVLFLVRSPPPQVAVHGDQEDHSPSRQSTGSP